MFLAINKL